MNLTDNYINKIKLKEEKSNLRQEILFGQVTGLLITAISFLYFLSIDNKMVEVILQLLMIVGCFMFISGVIFPYILYYPSKFFKNLINKIFIFIFSIILVIVYIIFILPVGLINIKKWKEKYNFISWNNKKEIKKFRGFVIRTEIQNDEDYVKRTGKFKNILKVLGYFINKKQFILIPILCILILLGFLLFFVTSSIVTPMIYTLF